MEYLNTSLEPIDENLGLNFLLDKSNSDLLCRIPQEVLVHFFEKIKNRHIQGEDIHNGLYLYDIMKYIEALSVSEKNEVISSLYQHNKSKIDEYLAYLFSTAENIKYMLLNNKLEGFELGLSPDDDIYSLEKKIKNRLTDFLQAQGLGKILSSSSGYRNMQANEVGLSQIIFVLVSLLIEDKEFLGKLLNGKTTELESVNIRSLSFVDRVKKILG